MDDKTNALASYSRVERHFYLMVLRCNECNSGPFEYVSEESIPEKKLDIWYVRCKKCKKGKRLFFDRSTLKLQNDRTPEGLPIVNPSNEPSKLIDLGQWLAIFYAIIEAAAREQDKSIARRLGYEAMLAIEEALKFYKEDKDLPPEDAFWTDESRKRFKEYPHLFTQSRIRELRNKLPKTHIIVQFIKKLDDSKDKKRWWKRFFS